MAARFPAGTVVNHKVFGRGTVQKVERDLVTVLFDGGKERTLKQDFLQSQGAAPASQAAPDSGTLRTGDRIRHSRWGNGVVKAADSATVTVVFPGITLSMSHEEARRG